MQEKVPTTMYVHSVRIELAKLIFVGTRITYQATGDAGVLYWVFNKKGKIQKAVYRLVTAPQGGTQKYTLAFAYDSPRWLVK